MKSHARLRTGVKLRAGQHNNRFLHGIQPLQKVGEEVEKIRGDFVKPQDTSASTKSALAVAKRSQAYSPKGQPGQPCARTPACCRPPPPSEATSFLPFPTIFQRHRKVKFSSAIDKIQNPEKRALLPLVFQRIKFYHKIRKKEEHLRTESSLRHINRYCQ